MSHRAACPHCGHQKNEARETTHHQGVTYRRRKCEGCGHIWPTVEIPLPKGMKYVYRYNVRNADKVSANSAKRLAAWVQKVAKN